MASAPRFYLQGSSYGCQSWRHLQDDVYKLLGGTGHSFGGEYRELVPSETLRHTDRFEDPNLPGEMQTTVKFRKVLCGTEISVVQEGIPEAIPLEMCYLGWQDSLAQLAKLVEPEIPG